MINPSDQQAINLLFGELVAHINEDRRQRRIARGEPSEEEPCEFDPEPPRPQLRLVWSRD